MTNSSGQTVCRIENDAHCTLSFTRPKTVLAPTVLYSQIIAGQRTDSGSMSQHTVCLLKALLTGAPPLSDRTVCCRTQTCTPNSLPSSVRAVVARHSTPLAVLKCAAYCRTTTPSLLTYMPCNGWFAVRKPMLAMRQ